MNKDPKVLFTIILAFALPMLTSALLDLDWVKASIFRIIIVVLFMIAQFVICGLVIKEIVKK